MDDLKLTQRVQGLEDIKQRALEMAQAEGDYLTGRVFITDSKKTLAFREVVKDKSRTQEAGN